MKCIFDKHLKADDLVILNLYKRTYPKWSHEEYQPQPDALRPFSS